MKPLAANGAQKHEHRCPYPNVPTEPYPKESGHPNRAKQAPMVGLMRPKSPT